MDEQEDVKEEHVKEDEDDMSHDDVPLSKAKMPRSQSPIGQRKNNESNESEAWKWWEETQVEEGIKWKFLQHKGPMFPPDYTPLPQGVHFYYNGEKMKLSLESEEVAGFYAVLMGHEHTQKDAFNINFLEDWRRAMTEEERQVITHLNKCDFGEINAYYMRVSQERNNRTQEEKEAEKEKNTDLQNEYGVCIVDNHMSTIGNFRIEPPGLFRGRGEHPKQGMLKKRVVPEDVIINCSKDSHFPEPPPGHKWKEVRHDNTVTWLASWMENIQNTNKYVMLNPSSKLMDEKDIMKYDKGRELKSKIKKIRNDYVMDFESKEIYVRQRSVALYLIDKLALRLGNDKEEDEADTVGVCSLRVEHITLHPEKDGKEEYCVEFDFLDTVPVEKSVFNNFKMFMENKSGKDNLFDRLNPSIMNEYLNSLMRGLTTKVFRTFNACLMLQEQLEELTDPDDSVSAKVLSYNRANRKVAILLNHQREAPKSHSKSMQNLQAEIQAKRQAVEKEVKAAEKGFMEKKKALERTLEELDNLETQAVDKEENKTIALDTSKLMYLDPRISVAWSKRFDVPIEKIFNRSQRDKFRWAIEMAGADFVF